jgi:DNA-binding PadR family transcriptional regulator
MPSRSPAVWCEALRNGPEWPDFELLSVSWPRHSKPAREPRRRCGTERTGGRLRCAVRGRRRGAGRPDAIPEYIGSDTVRHRQRCSQIASLGPAPVVKPTAGPQAFRRRLVGLYALSLMEREGPLHGYGLSERIAEKTEGAWRPGPGSVYPSLRKLTESGLARSRVRARRREYTITAPGRAMLRRMRARDGPLGRPRPDLSALWAEVMGAGDVDQFLLLRLRRTLGTLEAQIRRPTGSPARAGALRTAALRELSQASGRLRASSPRSHAHGRRAQEG